MLKNRSLRLAALLSLSLGLAPAALAAETPQTNKAYVFETVDSYLVVSNTAVEVTGILEGESTPRTLKFRASITDAAVQFSRCDRMAFLAMNKPGLYLFTMVQGTDSSVPVTCKLTRR